MAGRVFVVTSCNFTAPIATSGALSNPLEVLKRNQPALPVLGGDLCDWEVWFEVDGAVGPIFGNLGIEIARMTAGESIDGSRSAP